MTDFFSNGNAWLVAGLVLIIIEMVASMGYITLSFGLGSMATGVLVKLGVMPRWFDTSWADELLIAGVVSVIALVALRTFFKPAQTEDINQY